MNAATPDGVLPLHMAAQFGHVSAAAALVAGGADLAALSNDGFGVMQRSKSGES